MSELQSASSERVGGVVAMDKRRPRKLFSKLFDSASAVAQIKYVALGDSLAGGKMNNLLASLDRKIGGSNSAGVNTAGTGGGAGMMSAGMDCYSSALVSAVWESAMYQYWPTGIVLRIDAAGSVSWISGGVNPAFVRLRVYYVTEPGAGSINLVVGGVTVATASANAAVGAAFLECVHAYGSAAVSTTVTGASVRVLFVHVENTAVSGVDWYGSMSVGGLLLASSNTVQGMAIFQAVMTVIAPDFISFEMDDEFGTDILSQTAFSALASVLDTSAPYADKLVIGSTPRSVNDAGKIASTNWLRGQVAAKNASWLFFDSYYLMGNYAEESAIFGAGDGTHPTASAQAYAAEVLWDFLGLNSQTLGYATRAVNDKGKPSWFARLSAFFGGLDNLSVETDATFGYDWQIKFPRALSFWTRGSEGTANAICWQFSGNTAVAPNVMPLSVDFNSVGNVRKLSADTSSGLEFTRLQKTDNPNGSMHLLVGLIRGNFTRAQLLALPANSLLGSIAFCTDCAAVGGAQLVYARGGYPNDWVTVDGKLAI